MPGTGGTTWPRLLRCERGWAGPDLRRGGDSRMTDDLRFPIGKFTFDGRVTPDQRQAFIEQMAEAPAKLRGAVEGLSPEQIATPYRPGGWTVGQVVHHLPDSHLNGYTRTKLTLTEDEPTIKPYEEARWAELIDGRTARVETSLALLETLHERSTLLLRSLTPQQPQRR